MLKIVKFLPLFIVTPLISESGQSISLASSENIEILYKQNLLSICSTDKGASNDVKTVDWHVVT